MAEANEGVAPLFAVVGHPNKGKSTLVATLANDDRVHIESRPGTTVHATQYPMRVDGATLYALVDTPGFQRARGALAWLQAEADRTGADAAQRAELVRRFCESDECREGFPDEVELLTPIIEGAGILYVVDGSVPYGPDYEPEMEILRWSGRPSMAVINPIENADHVDEWRAALSQFFRVVRVLDAAGDGVEPRLDLLRAFGELEEAWRAPLQRAVDVLESEQTRRRADTAASIAELLVEAVALNVERRIDKGTDANALRPVLEEEYKTALRRLERRCRDRVESIYDFHDLVVEVVAGSEEETERALLESDLFGQEAWLVFGLRKRDLVTAGAAAGAATGGTIDVALGGASLLAGALIGGVVGGTLGWFGGARLADMKVLQQPLGGDLVRYGPATGPNLAIVLLGRARLHALLLGRRAHGRRDRADLSTGSLAPIDGAAARPLISALRRSGGPDAAEVAQRVLDLLN